MVYTDQLQRTVSLFDIPNRIISLVPSQTELLVDLGLEDRIVGVTKFCVHPSRLRKSKTIVGGTKNYRMEVIASLKPDLIIGNKEENDRVGIEELSKDYPVWMSDIYSLEDSFHMIECLGEIFQKEQKAKQLTDQLRNDFSTLAQSKGRAVYLIWNNPMMAAGKKTFIDEMIPLAGFENLIVKERYPVISEEELLRLNPDHLLLSSEPFPFEKKHLNDFQSLLPRAKVTLVDGELFSWYGSRLLKAKTYFQNL